MHNLLIAAAIDLGDNTGRQTWFADRAERIVGSLALGQAGDIFHVNTDSALLAARRAFPLAASGKPPLFRRLTGQQRPDGSYILLSGRVFDRNELAMRFGLPAGLDHADTYASLYERVGEDSDRLISGDYAVLQWFPKTRRLRLARSAINIQPLHVWRDGPRLVAATIPRTLFAAGAPSVINDDKVADAMLLNLREQTDSWFKDLSRVASGTIVTHDPRGTTTQTFWSVDAVKPVRFKRDTDYVEAVDEKFRKGVKAATEGFRQPGLMLSGGLDSQAVASYMIEQIPRDEQLRTYTTVPMQGRTAPISADFFGDERHNVCALAAMYPQIEMNFIDCPESRYGEKLADLFLLGSWPTHNEMVGHWTHALYSLAGKQGCDVLLHGGCGNPGFSYDGLTGYPTWLRQGKWARLAREVARSADPRPWWRRLVSLAVMPNLQLDWRLSLDRLRNLGSSPFESWCPLREEFASGSGSLDRARAAGHDFTFHTPPSARAWRASVIADTQTEGPELMTAYQLMYGVEVADPTAYQPLLDLCMGIPEEQYLRDGTTRWLARRLLRGRIPDVVREERRLGFIPSDWHLRMDRERSSFSAELEMLGRDPRIVGMFDIERIQRNLADWPGPDGTQSGHFSKLNLGLVRGVTTARFVRYVEGRNLG